MVSKLSGPVTDLRCPEGSTDAPRYNRVGLIGGPVAVMERSAVRHDDTTHLKVQSLVRLELAGGGLITIDLSTAVSEDL